MGSLYSFYFVSLFSDYKAACIPLSLSLARSDGHRAHFVCVWFHRVHIVLAFLLALARVEVCFNCVTEGCLAIFVI